MSVFFTADQHFGDERVIEFAKRDFPSVAAMDQALIDAWNNVVAAGDFVYVLGDFCASPEATIWDSYLQQLNGKVILLSGSHDSFQARTDSFNLYGCIPYKDIKFNGQRVILFHWPIQGWEGLGWGSWHLHGHTHGCLPRNPGLARADVGVDSGYFTDRADMRPLALEELEQSFLVSAGKFMIKSKLHQRESGNVIGSTIP